LKVVTGNLLDAKEKIIAHGCNCRGVMGSGVAKLIKEKWPIAFREYAEDLSHDVTSLGDSTITFVDDDKCIFNLLTQEDYGTESRMVNYAAIVTSLKDAIENYSIETGELVRNIAIPKIGAGLGGGNWKIIHQILGDFEKVYNIEFTVYVL
jgi:O-acetyl-ADP-ribose deacetylase (regulator of RNase III)